MALLGEGGGYEQAGVGGGAQGVHQLLVAGAADGQKIVRGVEGRDGRVEGVQGGVAQVTAGRGKSRYFMATLITRADMFKRTHRFF